MRYNTTVTFTLAAAMDAFLEQKAGPNAHLWDMVVDEVYRPIGILHAPTMHTLEPDGSRGLGQNHSTTVTKDALLPGRTHGQHAVPATFGGVAGCDGRDGRYTPLQWTSRPSQRHGGDAASVARRGSRNALPGRERAPGVRRAS